MTAASRKREPSVASAIAALSHMLSAADAAAVVDLIDERELRHPIEGFCVVHVVNGRWIYLRAAPVAMRDERGVRRLGTREQFREAQMAFLRPISILTVDLFRARHA